MHRKIESKPKYHLKVEHCKWNLGQFKAFAFLCGVGVMLFFLEENQKSFALNTLCFSPSHLCFFAEEHQNHWWGWQEWEYHHITLLKNLMKYQHQQDQNKGLLPCKYQSPNMKRRKDSCPWCLLAPWQDQKPRYFPLQEQWFDSYTQMYSEKIFSPGPLTHSNSL